MIERFAVRIYDPNGVIVPHKEFEIQSGITRWVYFHILLIWHHIFVPYVTIPNVRNNPERPFTSYGRGKGLFPLPKLSKGRGERPFSPPLA
jgi:hypothetical protein